MERAFSVPMNKWQRQTQLCAQYTFLFFAFCIPISLALENISFALALLFALISGLWWNYRKAVFGNAYTIFMLLLAILFFIGLFYSPSSMHWNVRVFKKEIEIVAILFLWASIPRTSSFLIQVIQTFVIGSMVVVVMAWLGYFHLLPNTKWFNHPAPYYTFFKIFAAMFMAFAAYLSLLLVKQARSMGMKFFWGICFLLITYNCLWQSLSRTGYIIYILGLVLFILFNLSWKQKVIAVLFIIVLGLVAFYSSTNLRVGFQQIAHNQKIARQGNLDTSTGVRIGYFKNSVTLMKQKPFFGQGTGGYRAADIAIKGITAAGTVTTKEQAQVSPENTFYRMGAEYGIVGLILFILLWGWQLVNIRKMPNRLYQQVALTFMLTMIVGSFSQDLILDESPRLFYILFSTVLYAPIVFKDIKLFGE